MATSAGLFHGPALYSAAVATLHESTDFPANGALPQGWDDDVYSDCTFADLNLEGQAFQGLLNACVLSNCAWYWGLFNGTRFIEVEFRNCVFRGSAFAACLFVKCRFLNCRFVRDRLDSPCRFDDCAWFACEQMGCEGLPHDDSAAPTAPGGIPSQGVEAFLARPHSPPMK